MLAPAGTIEQESIDHATADAPTRTPRFVFFLRFTLINIVCTALCVAAWLQGWLDRAFVGYSLWLCLLIFSVFVYGLGLCALRVWQVDRELVDLHAGTVRASTQTAWYRAQVAHGSTDNGSGATPLLRMRLAQHPSNVRHIAGVLVMLGLVGTVIGFIVALSGVDPQKVPTVENVAPMVARLIDGMSIALYTTLIGTVLHIWLMQLQRILTGGSLALYLAIVERRGDDA